MNRNTEKSFHVRKNYFYSLWITIRSQFCYYKGFCDVWKRNKKLYFPTVQLGYLITVIMEVKFEQSLRHCFIIQLNNSKVF